MLTIEPIQSVDHPHLQIYRTLRQPAEHLREGMFVAEGEKVVRRLLESPLIVLSLLLTREWLESLRMLLEARNESIRVFVAPKPSVESIVGFHLHQGIMAVGRVPATATLAEVIARTPQPRFFAALDGLTNAENIGVLTRNCAAFGVQGIIVGETSSSPFLRRAVRNSMGTVFQMPVVHADNLAGSLDAMRRDHGIRVFAAHPHATEHELPAVDLSKDCCWVFGSEGSGISSRVLECCDQAVAVPMRNGVDSLNVANAAAVFLYETYRQRR